SRLEDHRIPAQERGEHLPRRDREREVERRDESRDTDRPAEAHRPFVAQLRRHRATEQPPALRVGVMRGVDALLDVATRLGQDLPRLARHGARWGRTWPRRVARYRRASTPRITPTRR